MAIDRQQLIQRVQEIEGLSDDERAGLLQLLREQKKYGIVWEDKPEEAEERLSSELPVLTEVKERAIISDSPDAPNHILIEGDNLHALTALSYTHEGKIDVIYIDPPYNTGNKDFVYNDSYVDREDGYRHSKWLSFMNKRLKIAKRLLSERGVIFISIDDNEQAQLKLLCDEVFGESNFINCVSIKAKSSAGASGGGEDKKLKKNIEYLLIYSKVRDLCDIVFPQNKVPLFDYIQEKRDNNISWSYNSVMYNDGELNYIGKTQAGNGEDIELYEVKNHTILSVSEVCRIEGITEEEVYTKYINKIFTTENAQTSIRTRVAEAVNGDGLYIARYVPTSGRNKGKITDVGFIGDTKRLVSFLKHTCVIENGKVYKLEKIGTLWNDLSWSSVSKEGGVPFPAGKKPISLIKRVISMHPNSNSTVLDFFAGSGSTAHAVMSLNIDDNGKRQCVLVTSSENNICTEKTFPRCSNVINGYGNVPGLTDNTLRYYRTDFVPNETTIRNKRRLMALATDMLCIKNNLYCEQDEFAGRKLNKQKMRFFDNGKKQMLVVYDEMVVDALVDVLAEMDVEQKIMIYVFSNTSYPHTDNFEEVLSKVELCALPSAILNAYRKITGR